ncbi:MAG: AAA family ATPase [Anaerolineae bacterium]|nr:AAA family ATPase [Anaerolineae bacterium]
MAREHQITLLERHLEQALAGHGHVVFVTGGAGWGKTTLLRAFARHIQTKDLPPADTPIVAGGGCTDYLGIDDPYLPFREILASLTGDVEMARAIGLSTEAQAYRLWRMLPLSLQALIGYGPELVDTFIPSTTLLAHARAYAASPETGELEPEMLGRLRSLTEQGFGREEAEGPAGGLSAPGSGEAGQAALFYQYTRLLQALARRVPLLLMLDDLQWADLGSISLLFHLGRRLEGSRILIVGAYRPEEVAIGREGNRHPLAAVVNEFRRAFGDIIIELGTGEDREFVEAFLDAEPNRLGSTFRDTLHRLTGGHPLFTVELVRGMQERGDIVRDGTGRWVARPGLAWESLPARVEAAIAERIARLPETLQRLLTVSSVEGETFTAEVLAHVLGMDVREAVRYLSDEPEKRHQLVVAWGTRRLGARTLSGYQFRHFLIQRYLYRRLDGVERAHLHERVGNALEALYGDRAGEIAAQLARHFVEAGLAEKACQYLFLAGNQACRLHAYQEASSYFQRALALARDLDCHSAILARRARMLLGLYKGAEAARDYEELLADAKARGDRRREMESLLGLARAHLILAYDQPEHIPAAFDLFRRAHTLASDRSDKAALAQALVLWSDLYSIWPEPENEVIPRLEQALKLSKEIGNEDLIVDSTVALARFLDFPQAAETLETLREKLEERGDLIRLQPVYFWLISTYSYLGDFKSCIAYCNAAIRLSDQLGVLPIQYPTFKAMALMDLGRYDEAWKALQEEVADKVHRLARTFKRLGEGTYYLHLAAYDRAIELLRQAERGAQDLHRPWLRNWVLKHLVRALLAAGRLSEASDVSRGIGGNARLAPRDIPARLALARGRPLEALAELEAYCADARKHKMRDSLAWGLMLRARAHAKLRQPDEALVCADEALAIAEEMGYRPLLWRVYAVRAQALTQKGESAAAMRATQVAARVIRQLTDTIPQQDLRCGFLSSPEVSRVLTGGYDEA